MANDKHEVLKAMIGETPVEISMSQAKDVLTFVMKSDKVVEFYHAQECCEDVSIEEVAGDFEALLGHPILVAEKREREGETYEEEWTFYTFRTAHSTLDVRWYGMSNARHYSTEVSMRVR